MPLNDWFTGQHTIARQVLAARLTEGSDPLLIRTGSELVHWHHGRRRSTLLMTDRAKYGSVFSCLAKIASEDGLSGLYKGFLATWMRLGPWAFLFFVCFEQFRALAVGIQERLEAPAAAKRK